jgi:hypothetical protein
VENRDGLPRKRFIAGILLVSQPEGAGSNGGVLQLNNIASSWAPTHLECLAGETERVPAEDCGRLAGYGAAHHAALYLLYPSVPVCVAVKGLVCRPLIVWHGCVQLHCSCHCLLCYVVMVLSGGTCTGVAC